MRLAPVLGCLAAMFAVAPAAAMPRVALTPPVGVELARMVCDEWDRCWDEPDYGYYARPRYRYDYGEAYGGYDPPPRPPTKWERKGFCPPGQHKKGNC
jgi:hypothetical protein